MDYTYRDLLKETPDLAELKKLAAQMKMGVDRLVNTKSQDYKNLKPDLAEMKDSEIADLIKDYPRIMVRPIISDGQRMLTGFKEDEYSAFFSR